MNGERGTACAIAPYGVGLLGVEKSTVVDEVELDDEAATLVVPVRPRKGARGRCG